MEVGMIAPTVSPPDSSSAPNTFADLGSEDFLRLLIAQLINQDPLEPMGNAELLEQLSSVRELELSTTLTDSLRRLTGQERFGSATALIGKYVASLPGSDGLAHRGIVVAIRFGGDGSPILQLSDGTEIPVERVGTVEPPVRAAEALVGQAIVGLDQRDPSNPEVVEGVVTGVRVESSGEVFLELDNGKDLRFRDFVSIASGE